jgi:hypothetical protein
MNFTRAIGASALAAAAFLAFCAPAGADTKTLTVTMNALNGSGETGTAVLTQQADGVQVVVTLKGAPTTAQPTHIHAGTCGKINAAPEWPLTSLSGGTSTSVVKGVTIDQMLKSPYAINVHKSTDDLGTYVACGNIVAPKASSSM